MFRIPGGMFWHVHFQLQATQRDKMLLDLQVLVQMFGLLGFRYRESEGSPTETFGGLYRTQATHSYSLRQADSCMDKRTYTPSTNFAPG